MTNETQLEPRSCCECGETFTPKRERQIRCVPCQVASDFG